MIAAHTSWGERCLLIGRVLTPKACSSYELLDQLSVGMNKVRCPAFIDITNVKEIKIEEVRIRITSTLFKVFL